MENRTEAGDSRAQTLEQVMKHVLKAQARHDGKLMEQQEPGETISGCIMSQKMKRGGLWRNSEKTRTVHRTLSDDTERSPPSPPPPKDSDR